MCMDKFADMIRGMAGLLLAVSFLVVRPVPAQVVQKGSVKVFNSRQAPLPGVQLMAEGAPATDTDQQGIFHLHFLNRKPGMQISAPFVYKKGFELVNRDLLDGWILSEKQPLDVVMAPEGVIEEIKNRYYSISVADFARRFNETVQEINRLYERHEIGLQERKSRLQELADENLRFMSQVERYADRFARVNPDDVDDVERLALKLAGEGKIGEAVRVYEDADMAGKVRDLLSRKSEVEENTLRNVEKYYRFADLCMLAGGAENERKAYDICRSVAETLPDNFAYVLRYALMKESLQEEDVMDWLDKCQRLAFDEKSLLLVLNAKCVYELNMRGNPVKALEYAQNALRVLADASESMPSGDYLATGEQLFLTTARIYESMGMFDKAADEYEDGIRRVEEQLGESDNELFIQIQKSHLVLLYRSLASVCLKLGETERALEVSGMWRKVVGEAGAAMDEKERLNGELDYWNFLFELALEKRDWDKMRLYAGKVLALTGRLHELSPAFETYRYALSHVNYLLMGLANNPEEYLGEIWRFCSEVPTWSFASEEQKCGVAYLTEKLLVIYYSRTGNQAESNRHILQASACAERLEELNPMRYAAEIMDAKAQYIDLLVMQAKNQEACLEAMDLEALCAVSLSDDPVGLRVKNSVGTALVCGGMYELGVEYLEQVRKERERQLDRTPDDAELLSSLSTTYNNLSLGYAKQKKPARALKMQHEAARIMLRLYPRNKIQYGTNCLLTVLNTSVVSYQAGKREEALDFLEQAGRLAEELSQATPYFACYPLIIRLAKGDLYSKLSLPGGKEMLEEVLEYKEGMIPNDGLLLYSIHEYHTNGLYVK